MNFGSLEKNYLLPLGKWIFGWNNLFFILLECEYFLFSS